MLVGFMVESEYSGSRIFSFSLKTWMVGLVADEFFQHDFLSENFRIQQRKNSDWMKVGSTLVLAMGHVSTIGLPDTSGNQMPTVYG